MGTISLLPQSAGALALAPHMRIVRVEGDTMYPTFKNNDLLVVDTSQRDIREGVYVMEAGSGSMVVRRLQIHPGQKGRVLLGCDNRRYGEPESH